MSSEEKKPVDDTEDLLSVTVDANILEIATLAARCLPAAMHHMGVAPLDEQCRLAVTVAAVLLKFSGKVIINPA